MWIRCPDITATTELVLVIILIRQAIQLYMLTANGHHRRRVKKRNIDGR